MARRAKPSRSSGSESWAARRRSICLYPKDTNTILPTNLTALRNTDAADDNAAHHECEDIDATASISVEDEKFKHQARKSPACRGQAQSIMTFGTNLVFSYHLDIFWRIIRSRPTLPISTASSRNLPHPVPSTKSVRACCLLILSTIYPLRTCRPSRPWHKSKTGTPYQANNSEARMYTARRLRTMLKAYTTPKVCLKQRIIQPPDNYSVMTPTSIKRSQHTYGASSTVATVVASLTKTIIAVTFGNEASRTGRIVISAASPSAAKVIEMLTSQAVVARSSIPYFLMWWISAKTIGKSRVQKITSAKAFYA
jgi:hypothetical protein